jgi:hypothetical protein
MKQEEQKRLQNTKVRIDAQPLVSKPSTQGCTHLDVISINLEAMRKFQLLTSSTADFAGFSAKC